MNINKLKYKKNNRFIVIAISGKARHGKDTIADIIEELCDELNLSHQRIALAKTIKDYAKMLGWDGSEETKPRELLQKLGTDIIRNELKKPLYHATRLCDDIDVLSGYNQVFIVNDVRFHNELNYIMARFPYNIVTIRVNRNNFTSSLTPQQQIHQSEIDLDNYDNWDIIIDNNGSIDDLKEKTKKIFDKEFRYFF